MYKQYGSLEGRKYPGVMAVEKLTRRNLRVASYVCSGAGETHVVGPDSHREPLRATRADFVEETGAVEDDDAAARGIDVEETAVGRRFVDLVGGCDVEGVRAESTLVFRDPVWVEVGDAGEGAIARAEGGFAGVVGSVARIVVQMRDVSSVV